MDFQAQLELYDLLILGSGAGSKLPAWTFAGQGQRVAVVERKYVGGSCPNIACLPRSEISGNYAISGGTCSDNGTAVLRVSSPWDY